jgi:serine/threonine protein kinase
MISGKFPFDGDSIFHLFENIAKCEYQVPDEADTILSELMQGIMEKDPDERFTMSQIKVHK